MIKSKKEGAFCNTLINNFRKMEPQFSEKNTPTTRFTFVKNNITKNN